MKTDKDTLSSNITKNHRANDSRNVDYLTVASADAERLRRARARERQRKQRKRRRIILSGIMVCLVLTLVLLIVHCVKKSGEEENPARTDTNHGASLRSLPEGWEWQQMTEADLSQGTLILVNRDHAYDPDLPRTVSVYDKKTQSYFVKDKILSLREDAADALNQWMDAFAAESGKTDVNIVAGWRSYDDHKRHRERRLREEYVQHLPYRHPEGRRGG